MSYYTDQDKARMKYYLVELEEKFVIYPASLPLRNGIVYIRKILGLPKTIDSVDPIKHLNQMLQTELKQKQGR